MKTTVITTALFLCVLALHGSPPPNDDFQNATVLVGENVSSTGTNKEATEQNDQPDIRISYSSWWRWTAPGTGVVSIDTEGSNLNTAIAVFVGATLDKLTLLAVNDDAVGVRTSRVEIPTAAGETYSIVAGIPQNVPSPFGTYPLNIHWKADSGPAPVVGADEFAERRQLIGTDALGIAHNAFADTEVQEPALGNGKSLWWTWTAPTTGAVTIDTDGSDFTTQLSVFVGDDLAALDLIAVNDHAAGKTFSQVSFQTSAGMRYQIRVCRGGNFTNPGFVITGHIRLRLRHEPNAFSPGVPGTDSFQKRGELTGSDAAGVASNVLGTTQPGENLQLAQTVWWTWNPPADGLVTINTIGSVNTIGGDFNTNLGVFRGEQIDHLSPATYINYYKDFNGKGTSQIQFRARRHEAVQIAVATGDGFGPAPGNVVLNLHQEVEQSNSLRIRPAVEVEFQTIVGIRYQLVKSVDLYHWVNVGEPFVGDGTWRNWFFPAVEDLHEYYRALPLR